MTNMCTQSKILAQLAVVLLISSQCAAGAYNISKPGCQDECGGVKIPFPFGIGNGCYLTPGADIPNNGTYRINCHRDANDTEVPFLHVNDRSSLEVLSINLDDHSFRVSSRIAYECYDELDKSTPSPTTLGNSSYELQNIWPFVVSATRNRLVVVGCNTVAMVTEVGRSSVCMTVCKSLDDARNETEACGGSGCCQGSLFNGMSHPSIVVDGNANGLQSQVRGFSPCSYAFVGEVGSYSFSVTNLTVSENDCDEMRVAVVYDWSVLSSISCSKARSICGAHARCVDAVDVAWGYRCQCLKGYTGSPYLPHGCQDVNECLEERLNQCERQEYCMNKKGGYDCRCPKGLRGGGTSTNPCIAPTPTPTLTPAKLVLGLSIGMGSMIGLVILYGLYKLLKRRIELKERKLNFKRNGGLLLEQQVSTNEGAIDRTKIFSRSELEKATDNFNDNRVLGRGGQGTVYKGMLVDGTIVAVKKSIKVNELQLSQFINEVAILSQINHRNVVKLFGCCLETEVPLLVYEFVPNGTLYQHIHHPSEDFPMTWKVRFQIAVECAGAIAYLHSSCSSPIYHRDIKSSNILLDEKYRAKVSDFGTSKTVSIDKTHVTTCVRGTFGYLDPEFFRSNQFSEKSDVYSFGVVLLELITGMKPIFTDSESREPKGLVTEFLRIMESSPNQLHGILDNQVKQSCSKEEIEALAKLIEKCLSLNGKERPTMRELVMTLETIMSRHDEQGIRRQELHLSRNHTSRTNEDLAYNTSTTSVFTDNSMDAEPLLFDSI